MQEIRRFADKCKANNAVLRLVLEAEEKESKLNVLVDDIKQLQYGINCDEVSNDFFFDNDSSFDDTASFICTKDDSGNLFHVLKFYWLKLDCTPQSFFVMS